MLTYLKPIRSTYPILVRNWLHITNSTVFNLETDNINVAIIVTKALKRDRSCGRFDKYDYCQRIYTEICSSVFARCSVWQHIWSSTRKRPTQREEHVHHITGAFVLYLQIVLIVMNSKAVNMVSHNYRNHVLTRTNNIKNHGCYVDNFNMF